MGYFWVNREQPRVSEPEDPWTWTGLRDHRGWPIYRKELDIGFHADHTPEYGTKEPDEDDDASEPAED